MIHENVEGSVNENIDNPIRDNPETASIDRSAPLSISERKPDPLQGNSVSTTDILGHLQKAEVTALSQATIKHDILETGVKTSLINPTIYQIIKIACAHFTTDGMKIPKIIFLHLCIIVKNLANLLSLDALDGLDKKSSKEQRDSVIISVGFHLLTHSLNYSSDWYFEKYCSKYGAAMNIFSIEHIFNCDDVKVNDLNPSKSCHCIENGSNAMARVAKYVLKDFPSKVVHLGFDCGYIYHKDTSKTKSLFFVFFAGAILLTIVKMMGIYYSMPYVRIMTRAAAERDKVMTEILEKSSIIKSYNVDSGYFNKFYNSCRSWIRNRRQYKFFLFTSEFIHKVFSLVYRLGVCLLFIIVFQEKTEISAATLIKLLLDTIKTLEKLSDLFKDASEAVAEAEMIVGYLHLLQEDEDKKYHITDFKDAIEFKDVVYKTIDNQRVIFDGLNFKLNAGSRAVLFGANGAGKSSIFKILMNMAEYQGLITIDNIKNTSISRKSLSNILTVVPQNTPLMDGTIYFNIKFGSDVTFEEVEQVCKEISIHDTISSLPSGYNEQVGEEGRLINGGLRQKIFYARAILRNTPLFLFDEPTNNLDPVHSMQFMKYLLESKRFDGKTLFVICHDPQSISQFPVKYHFADGKVSQVSTY